MKQLYLSKNKPLDLNSNEKIQISTPNVHIFAVVRSLLISVGYKAEKLEPSLWYDYKEKTCIYLNYFEKSKSIIYGNSSSKDENLFRVDGADFIILNSEGNLLKQLDELSKLIQQKENENNKQT